jgi:predicted GH43/DUF377 family glycosyl hydrolase
MISPAPPVTDLAVRTGPRLRPDPARVITKLFVPGDDVPEYGSRSAAVIDRVMAMDEAAVAAELAATLERFAGRHPRLADTFTDHFESVSHRVALTAQPSAARCRLIGAYFTHEYAVEGAALFNPSIVPAPDQSGQADGRLRFVMSVRAVGEGHLSSIGFRTGVIGPDDELTVDDPGPHLFTGQHRRVLCDNAVFHGILAEEGYDDELTSFLRRHLSARFTDKDLEQALSELHPQLYARESAHRTVDRIHEIAANNYEVEFSEESDIGGRVMWPVGPSESHGMEDARFVLFTEDDGTQTYYATYTAYDGRHIAPQLLETADFRTFRTSQLTGPAAVNKGMALFPRRIGGRYFALSRRDRESNSLTSSDNMHTWPEPRTLQTPRRPWELVQLGNCGSPIETEAGWLVLTHGVGPMRDYAISAILLDLEDPYRILGSLSEPLLTAQSGEREGYVPNVVYSCGALVHQGSLILPYGTSDTGISFARTQLSALLERLTTS